MHKPIYLFVSPFFPTPESWRGGFCYDMARALVRVKSRDALRGWCQTVRKEGC